MNQPATHVLKTTMHAAHADLVRRAAEKTGKTVSEYISDLLAPWAASDLGVPLPRLPRLGRRWQRDLVSKAAEAAGMSPAEFREQAIAKAALERLGFESEIPPPPETPRVPRRESGFLPRVAAGTRR